MNECETFSLEEEEKRSEEVRVRRSVHCGAREKCLEGGGTSNVECVRKASGGGGGGGRRRRRSCPLLSFLRRSTFGWERDEKEAKQQLQLRMRK